MFDKLIARLTDQVTEAHPQDLALLYVPFLRTLLEILQKASTTLSPWTCQSVFRGVFTALLERWVGKEPPQPSDLRMKPVSCHCEDCRHRNAFLASPSQLEYVFRGQHIEGEIRRHGTPCRYATVHLNACNRMALYKEFHEYDGAKEA